MCHHRPLRKGFMQIRLFFLLSFYAVIFFQISVMQCRPKNENKSNNPHIPHGYFLLDTTNNIFLISASMKSIALVLLLGLQLVFSYSRFPCTSLGYEKYLSEYSSKRGTDLESNYE